MSDTPKSAARFQEREPDLNSKDPYCVLGIAKTAVQVEIKRAYFDLIRQYPPETEGETFKIIRGAYEQIRSAKRRAETDAFLPQAPPVWQPSASLPEFDSAFHREDVLLALQRWGDLGRTDFRDDFQEIKEIKL